MEYYLTSKIVTSGRFLYLADKAITDTCVGEYMLLSYFIEEVKNKMLNFENYEYIADYMKDYINDVNDSISDVTNKDMAVEIMYELLRWEDVNLSKCNIEHDSYYDKEYLITLYYDPDDNDKICVDVEEAYSDALDRYIVGSDSVLFYEDVNSKALIDMENNPFFENIFHDWLTIGLEESEDFNEDDSKAENGLDASDSEDESTDSGYSVTVKVGLDTEEAEGIIRDMNRNLNRHVSNMFDMLYRPHLYKYRPHPIRFYW